MQTAVYCFQKLTLYANEFELEDTLSRSLNSIKYVANLCNIEKEVSCMKEHFKNPRFEEQGCNVALLQTVILFCFERV
jgi:hypothetical protein